VPGGDFANYWGAQLVIQLLDGTRPARPPWDRGGGQVRGLSFRITGTHGELTFQVATPASTLDNPYGLHGVQLPASSDGQLDVLFESLSAPPWAPTTELPETLLLQNIGWQINSADFANTFESASARFG
jgi:hypothetical protein